MQKELSLKDFSNTDPESKAEITERLKRLAKIQAAELGRDPAEMDHVKYPNNMCVNCYRKIGTVFIRLNLVSDYDDPDAIWVVHMMCERCVRVMETPAHTQTVCQKISDVMTVWLYSQVTDWVSA